MPYINQQTVKEIRAELKKEFPNLKMSITCQNYNSLHVAILSGNILPLKLKEGWKYESVNQYWIERDYKDEPEWLTILTKINKIANKKNGTEVIDGDYGHVPHYYFNLSIGKWDRPYIYV